MEKIKGGDALVGEEEDSLGSLLRRPELESELGRRETATVMFQAKERAHGIALMQGIHHWRK